MERDKQHNQSLESSLKNLSADKNWQKRNWVAQKNHIVLLFVFLTFPLMSHAGGLGIAAIVALSGILGLIGFRPPHPRNMFAGVPLALWALMVFLLWALISSFWTPYQSNDILANSEKLFIGVSLFLGCAAIIHAQHKYDNRALQWILMLGTLISAAAILVDVSSSYSLTRFVRPVLEGEDHNRLRGDAMQNLGHAVSVLTLLLAPVGILMWQKGGLGKLGAILLAGLAVASAWVSEMNACVLALVVAFMFMALAISRPKFAICLGFLFAAASILFAPLLALLAKNLGLQNRAVLPISWEDRAANWGYMYDKIIEQPWFGHGFDAVRTFKDTHTIRGFEGRALVSLHPHNAGIHIWAETGLVGVVLACLALFLGVRQITRPVVMSHPQMVAASGLLVSVTVMASLSYGVWQHWWWAAIIFAAAIITFISRPVP